MPDRFDRLSGMPLALWGYVVAFSSITPASAGVFLSGGAGREGMIMTGFGYRNSPSIAWFPLV